MTSRLIAALDSADRDQVFRWAEAVAPHCGLLKLGLEYFVAHGPAGVAAIAQAPVFLDLKLHDIPNTVAGAVRAVLPLKPAMLTLHAGGGAAMIKAARREADASETPPILVAVTVLTAIDQAGLESVGVSDRMAGQVLRLAHLALDAGADGLVCSAHELAVLRREFGPGPTLVVPGIRPAGAPPGDQVRTMTPVEAVDAGADWIVVGRPITGSDNPASSARAIAAQTQPAQSLSG